MNAREYSDYSVEEWVQDRLFRNYVLNQDSTYERFWKEVGSESEEVSQRIKEASDILHAMYGLHKDYQEEGVRRSERSLVQMEQRMQEWKKRSNRRIISTISAAASIAIAVFALWLLQPSSGPEGYITTANETQEVLLPDGSLVYLNENSSLTIDDNWQNGIREVALEGEGYFMVRSQEDSAGQKTKFTVKTDGLDIEVLGTQFNVNTHDTVTSVALDEGSVKLIKENVAKEESYMVPGQMASFNRRSKEIQITEKTLANADALWKPQTIEFNQIKLSDAIDKMETAFGLRFLTANIKILDLKIDKLSVPSDDPDVFIKTVNILFADKIMIEVDPDTGIYYIRELNRTIDQ